MLTMPPASVNTTVTTVSTTTSTTLNSPIDDEDFPEEHCHLSPPWKGYIEWSNDKTRSKLAAQVLAAAHPVLPRAPKSLIASVPICGKRWTQYHKLLGGTIARIPAMSEEVVRKEKDLGEKIDTVVGFPWNGETKMDVLTAAHITPTRAHFVRNHGGIPDIPQESYFFSIYGQVAKPLQVVRLDILEALMKSVEREVTIECAGCRRREWLDMGLEGQGDELLNTPWGPGAISTAVYTGVPLRHVLTGLCGGILDSATDVELHGCDTYIRAGPRGEDKSAYNPGNYVVSIPLRIVLDPDPDCEVLLAWGMNGGPLPRVHGGPLRVVAPGIVGARSVKWLRRIIVLSKPSTAPAQRKEYLFFPQHVNITNETAPESTQLGRRIQGLPISSALAAPKSCSAANPLRHDGEVEVRGWAFAGRGSVTRVDVSFDDAHTWYTLPPSSFLSPEKRGVWRLFAAMAPVGGADGWRIVRVRAWDEDGNTQDAGYGAEMRGWNWGLHTPGFAQRVRVYLVRREAGDGEWENE